LNLSSSYFNALTDGSIANLDKDYDVVAQQNTDQWGRTYQRDGTVTYSSPHPLIRPIKLSTYNPHRSRSFYESQPRPFTSKTGLFPLYFLSILFSLNFFF
jgi:hypothetical protein